eukprot:scaffold92794_cov54-Phaeocystis_antarctica.AAC.1
MLRHGLQRHEGGEQQRRRGPDRIRVDDLRRGARGREDRGELPELRVAADERRHRRAQRRRLGRCCLLGRPCRLRRRRRRHSVLRRPTAARFKELRLQRGLEPFGRQAAPLQLRLEHGDRHLADARLIERGGRCRHPVLCRRARRRTRRCTRGFAREQLEQRGPHRRRAGVEPQVPPRLVRGGGGGGGGAAAAGQLGEAL